MTYKIALFASGNGSNVEAIIKFFKGLEAFEISEIYTNNPMAYVLERAKNHGIPSHTFNYKEFHSPSFANSLIAKAYDLIVLAGFMWLVPPAIVRGYQDKILNIHPALLPKYGGKGMYGHHVHEAVINHGEIESGITIHLVNEYYDEGSIIFQAKCPVLPEDDPDSLAERIHKLEHQHYPSLIKDFLLKKNK